MSQKIVMPVPPGGSRATARIDALSAIPITHQTTVPPPPRSVKVELTAQCNYGCRFCAHPGRSDGYGEMRWPLYTRLVGEMVDAGVEELGLFFIGESFLCEWLPDAIAHAKARGLRHAYLATNGSLATPQRVRECLDAGLDALRFSMDFADEAQFVELAGAAPARHREAIENLTAARHVRDEGNYACAIHATSIRFGRSQQDRMQPLVSRILPYVDEHFWVPLHAMPGGGADKPEPLPCASLFTEAHVTHDGKLTACRFEVGERWVMADLEKLSFLDGWTSAPFARLRDAHLKRDLRGTACQGCAGAR